MSRPQPVPEPSPAAVAPDAEVGYAVGKRRPPLATRFAPGVSGNPHGRPRRTTLAAAARRRVIAAEPTELERALAEPVMSMAVDASAPVSLARAVIARLTERALAYGDVAACRELVRLCAEAEALAAERALLAAEQAEVDAAAAEAAERAAREAEAEAAEEAQRSARVDLEELADFVATQAGDDALCPDLRALKALDAVEFDDELNPVAVREWVAEAAVACGAAGPVAPGARPLDLTDVDDALRRLDVVDLDAGGWDGVSAWVVDAARARRPDWKPTRAERIVLALSALEAGGAEPDWVERLRSLEDAEGGTDSAPPPACEPGEAGCEEGGPVG